MGVMDAKLELSDAQSITDSANSTNLVDLGAGSLYIGAGTPLYLNVRVNTTLVGGGQSSGSLTVNLMEGANTICTGTTLASKTIATSLLAAGKWIMRIPIPFEGYMRYLRVYYNNSRATTSFTAGKIDAWISAATPDSNVGIST